MSQALTLVASHSGKPISTDILDNVEQIIAAHGLAQTAETSWLSPEKAADIGLAEAPSAEFMVDMRTSLKNYKIDVFCQPIDGRKKKLLLADMDSTIVTGETLDELAEFAGLKDEIARITTQAMEGKLDFHGAVKSRVSLLKDLPADTLDKTLKKIEISPGAKQLVGTMSRHGTYCVLVSGGFTFFTKQIANMLGFHKHHGNTLQIERGKLTGKVVEPIQDKFSKLEYLKSYCQEMKITPSGAMTIGDGANDIPMLESAGLGIGYRPKKAVAEAIQNVIIHGDLTAALYAQGYTDHHIKATG